jgi:hypothetical protein
MKELNTSIFNLISKISNKIADNYFITFIIMIFAVLPYLIIGSALSDLIKTEVSSSIITLLVLFLGYLMSEGYYLLLFLLKLPIQTAGLVLISYTAKNTTFDMVSIIVYCIIFVSSILFYAHNMWKKMEKEDESN